MLSKAVKSCTMAAFLPGRSGFAAESADMSHRRAVALMVLVTLLWSIAGVVSRGTSTAAGSFEVTFWRSAVQCAGPGHRC
jgi:hypothetical protein